MTRSIKMAELQDKIDILFSNIDVLERLVTREKTELSLLSKQATALAQIEEEKALEDRKKNLQKKSTQGNSERGDPVDREDTQEIVDFLAESLLQRKGDRDGYKCRSRIR